MRNFYIVDIEPLDNRYTKQWQTHIPEISKKYLGNDYNVVNIAGVSGSYSAPQPGAFFDFIGTCAYKASQAQQITALFNNDLVKDGDIFFFTDAWNQTVHYVKYMIELKGLDVKLAGIWHAGAYDPTDILGVTIKNKRWAHEFERSLYHAFDLNFFGSKHHSKLFLKTLGLESFELQMQKCKSPSGYPLEWIIDLKNNQEKEDIVVFPHRLNYDKAPWVFDEIAAQVHKTHPNIKFMKTQEMNMSKEEYYQFLKRCKVIFSANKHENLGIGTFEATVAGCLPVLPDKLSYSEMYGSQWKYNVPANLYYIDVDRSELANKIIDFVTNYSQYVPALATQIEQTYSYFTGEKMFEELKKL